MNTSPEIILKFLFASRHFFLIEKRCKNFMRNSKVSVIQNGFKNLWQKKKSKFKKEGMANNFNPPEDPLHKRQNTGK